MGLEEDALAERMALHGPTKIVGLSALELAFEKLGISDMPASKAIHTVRDRADELPDFLRDHLIDQGILRKSAA